MFWRMSVGKPPCWIVGSDLQKIGNRVTSDADFSEVPQKRVSSHAGQRADVGVRRDLCLLDEIQHEWQGQPFAFARKSVVHVG